MKNPGFVYDFEEYRGINKRSDWNKINRVPDELISTMGETLKFENGICNAFQIYFSNICPNLAMSVVPDIGDPAFEV